MVLDATKRAEQRALLEAELDAVGIRLNKEPPNIYLPDATENQRFKGGPILQRRNFTWTDVSDIHEQERGMFLANTGSV